MKRLMSVLVCLSFAGALAFGVAFVACREWGRLPFAEYESECGLETGSMVQGRVCYDFSEDKLNATRFCELRETAESWKSDLFHERVMASVRMNAVVSKIGTNEALRIIRSTQVEVVPRQCSVLVRTKGRDLKSVVEVAEIYALEISRAGSESEVERSEKILSQLARNLECQTTVVSKIERRLSALQLEHSIIRSNEIAKLQKELVSAKSLCEKMEMQFVNTKTSFKCGTMGSFVRMSRKATKTKTIVPSFWEVWFWLFPVLLLVIVIMFRRFFLIPCNDV